MKIEEWQKNTEEELNHWNNVFKGYTDDVDSYYHYYTKKRLDEKLKLHTNVQKLVDEIDKNTISILDVGSGPLPFLGKLSNKKLLYTAVDYLADEYHKLYDKYNIHPPIKPIRGDASELNALFVNNSFDIVYARNSIDHTYNPIESIKKMIEVSNKYIIMEHKINEGIVENYQGLHNWNFYTKESMFYISNKFEQEFCLNELLSNVTIECNITVEEEENIKDWLVIVITKLK